MPDAKEALKRSAGILRIRYVRFRQRPEAQSAIADVATRRHRHKYVYVVLGTTRDMGHNFQFCVVS